MPQAASRSRFWTRCASRRAFPFRGGRRPSARTPLHP
jgi:hypothetical protein